MKNRFFAAMLVGAALVVGTYGTYAVAQNKLGSKVHDSKLPLCPVTGEAASYFVSAQTADGPVYFCCKGCVKKFKKNSAKYATGVERQRAVLAKLPKVQVTCPVSGETVDPEVTLDHNGEKVAFCCKKCRDKFKSYTGRFAAKLAASYTYQTKCPIMGEEIDPAAFTQFSTGERVYYCCPKCANKLIAAPAKYNDKLVAQGVNIDWDKAKPVTEK